MNLTMKKMTLTLFIALILFSCKAQKRTIETKSKDIRLFNFEKEVSILNSVDNQKVYSGNDFLIFTQNWSGYGYYYYYKEYSFTQAQDTMNIKCSCGQGKNYFFKNLEFKKGNYELRFNFPLRYNDSTKKYESVKKNIFGKQIEIPKEVQQILFKNAYARWEKNDGFKDLYFKDLKFIEIDLKDSISVKLKKIE